MSRWPTVLPLLFLSFPLASCGGGGAEPIASLPPVPDAPNPVAASSPSSAPSPTVTKVTSPAPSTPALVSGTYDTIAIGVEKTGPGPGEKKTSSAQLQIKVDAANKTYTLLFPAGSSQEGSEIAVQDPESGQHIETNTLYPDGRTETTSENAPIAASYSNGTPPADVQQGGIWSSVSLRHASFGSWAYVPLGTDPSGRMFARESARLAYFAYGDRTSAADIPVHGSATYDVAVAPQVDAGWLSSPSYGPPNIALTADFGLRTVSATLDMPNSEGTWGGEIPGYHVAGTAPYSTAGAFTIALAGDSFGMLDGAFYGPQASEVAGVFRLANGSNGAFGGVRK